MRTFFFNEEKLTVVWDIVTLFNVGETRKSREEGDDGADILLLLCCWLHSRVHSEYVWGFQEEQRLGVPKTREAVPTWRQKNQYELVVAATKQTTAKAKDFFTKTGLQPCSLTYGQANHRMNGYVNGAAGF